MPSSRKQESAEQLPPELESEQIVELPAREALSIVDPGIFGLRQPVPLPRQVDDATAVDISEADGSET